MTKSLCLCDSISQGVRVYRQAGKKKEKKKMPSGRFAGSFLFIDMGNPFLNQTLKAFMTIGTIAAAKTAADEYYYVVKRGSISQHKFEDSLKKMCREGAYWGTVGGVYAGMDYGVKRIREERDWKNAMITGALTGALVSAACNNNRDKIVMDAITGGAVATAMEFHNYLS